MAKGKYRAKKKNGAADTAGTTVQKEDTEAAGESRAQAPVIEYRKDAESLTDLDFEYQAALNAAGREEKVYGVWGPVWKLLKWYDSKKGRHTFKKRTYLWLMLFLGWMGGHRYYQGRKVLALFYTLFFWTGIPFILCVTDFMEVIPLKTDENGMVTL